MRAAFTKSEEQLREAADVRAADESRREKRSSSTRGLGRRAENELTKMLQEIRTADAERASALEQRLDVTAKTPNDALAAAQQGEVDALNRVETRIDGRDQRPGARITALEQARKWTSAAPA